MPKRLASFVASAAGLTILATGALAGVAGAAPARPPGGPGDITNPTPSPTPPSGPGDITNPTPAPSTPTPSGPGQITNPTPAPSNPGDIAEPPPVSSGAKLYDFTNHPVEAFSFTYNWKSNRKTSVFQVSTKKPKEADDVFTFPQKVPSVNVKGTPIGGPGDGGSVAGEEPEYKFTYTVQGTQPETKHYVLVSVPLGDSFIPVQRAWQTTTKAPPALPPAKLRSRLVSIKVTKIKVIKDGDTGLRGRGEVSFGVRLAPDADRTKPSMWGDFSHGPKGYFKAKDGQTLNLSNALTHEIITTKNKALVEVQGLENDRDLFEGFCPLGTFNNDVAREFSDSCYDASVARALVKLPNKSGVDKQTITADVPGSPGLKFEATVLVTSSVA